MNAINLLTLFLFACPLSIGSIYNTTNSTVSEEQSVGMNFSSSEIYEVDCPYQEPIKTFEAVISLPKTTYKSAGTLLGSKGVSCGSINFDISSNGMPRIYSVDLNKNETSILFNKCDVRSDSKVHLAITIDSVSKKSNCYINGVLVQTKNSFVSDYQYIKSCVLGGDWSNTTHGGNWNSTEHAQEECLNTSYFLGTIYDVALYSSIRSEEQIKSDALSINDYEKDLFAHYELNGETSSIKNKAGNDYNIYKRARHIKAEDVPELKDYEYSMAIIGDTQFTCSRYPQEFTKIFDDLREHAANNKLKYVISMGDNCDQDTNSEWQLVQEQYKTLDGIVGYAVNVGNHESNGQINKYFSNTDYLSTLAGCYNGNNVENSYRFLNIGDVKYIIFTLEYGAGPSVLEWAGDICDSFPDHKVICSTHGYLNYDGTTLDRNDADVPTKEGKLSSGDDLWNNFFSQHENIVLCLCGHIANEDVLVRQEEGENGNIVTSMLVNNQANDLYDKKIDSETGEYVGCVPLGMIYYLYFSKDGSHVQARYYSPIQDMYLCYSNQREITLYDGIDFETDSITGVIKDEHITNVSFDKITYKVGDTVNFNVELENDYEISSVEVNGTPALVSRSDDYSYCYVASEKDCVKITSILKLENKLKDVTEDKKENFVLPILLFCIGGSFIGGAIFLFIKFKGKKS